jgi:hypothetical protein
LIGSTGVGPFGVGLVIEMLCEGWYLMLFGGNLVFICDMLGLVSKVYGVVVMVIGGSGPIIREIEDRVAAAYGWDSLDKPIPR